MAKIIYFNIDSTNSVTGGILDGTKGQIVIRNWYNKNWKAVLRPISSADVKELVSKLKNTSPEDVANSVEFIKQNLSFMKNPHLNRLTPENAITNMIKSGRFSSLSDPRYLMSSEELKVGDILVSDTHMAVVIENGINISETPDERFFNLRAKNKTQMNKGKEKITIKRPVDVKSGPALKYQTYETLPEGTTVEVLKQCDENWFKIVFVKSHSGYGYIRLTKEDK